jgi:hypothetical protein
MRASSKLAAAGIILVLVQKSGDLTAQFRGVQ